jgi:exopolyphosphatase/guanosine-5'-triphosphate,3'-diphosphate pyrophosphatase
VRVLLLRKIKSKILQETGIEVEIITGNEEANLIFGTFFLMDIDKAKPFIVVDVGGGSTEISVFSNGHREISQSFEVGTLRLLKGKTDKNVWNEIYQWLDENIPFKGEFTFFATGGNINKAHKMLGGVNMEPIEFSKLKQLKDDLSALSLRKRMEQYQLKPDRADVLVPALEIYCNIMQKLNSPEIVVPKIGLSDGIVYDLHKKYSKRKKSTEN